MLTVRMNGRICQVSPGSTVLAALADEMHCRTASDGQARGPLCGIGICQECAMWIDGHLRLACCTLACDDMEVVRA